MGSFLVELLLRGLVLCLLTALALGLLRRMRFESESACDDRVLLSGIVGPDYAAHLLQILRAVRTGEIAPAMALSGGMEDRMRHILDAHKPRRARRIGLALAASFGIVSLSFAALRVSARPAAEKPRIDRDASLLTSRSSVMSPRPSDFLLPTANPGAPGMAALPSADLPPLSTPRDTPATQHSAPNAPGLRAIAPQGDSPASEQPGESPAIPIEHVVWSKAVDGLETGILLNTPGFPDNRVAFNSHLSYQVLVRNTARQERVVEVQCQDFNAMDPYLIPDTDIRKALGGSSIPQTYQAQGIYDDRLIYLGYAVKLSPGEAVVVPDGDMHQKLQLYVGDAEKQSYPRIEAVTRGLNWLVQAVRVRALTPAEAAQETAGEINLTIVSRDGRSGMRSAARRYVGPGSKTLYAKIRLAIGTVNAANPPEDKPVQWGETVGGFQLGARIVQDETVFKVGDVIKFQAFGRNLSGKDASLRIGNYWKVNYKIQVETLDGKPVYMERDARNRAMLVAGYIEGSLGNGVTQEISEARLKIAPRTETQQAGATTEDREEWVEAVPLKPGRYRVRLLSWGVFGTRKPEPASGWIPIEVKGE